MVVVIYVSKIYRDNCPLVLDLKQVRDLDLNYMPTYVTGEISFIENDANEELSKAKEPLNKDIFGSFNGDTKFNGL